MSERNPFLPERDKRVKYFPLGEVADRGSIKRLSSVLDEESLKKFLSLRLENTEPREAYAKRFLDIIAEGLETRDKEKIITGLTGIGIAVESLRATEDERVFFFASSVSPGPDGAGKYVLSLGSGTGGQRILLRPSPERHGEFEKLLVFPSQGERVSGDYQRAFSLLVGSRAHNISPPQADPYFVASVIENNEIDVCPCGSRKKYKKCHGA